MPPLSPSGAAFSLPETAAGYGYWRLVRICLTAPTATNTGGVDASNLGQGGGKEAAAGNDGDNGHGNDASGVHAK